MPSPREPIGGLHRAGQQRVRTAGAPTSRTRALTQHIKKGLIPSLIFWGPPGIGKTTLANIIAKESQRPFYTLSAVSSGVKDVRDVIQKAKQSGGLFTTKNPILFIDEIHRFSKSQQDSLLGAVEKGFGGCVIASINRDELRETLSIPDRFEILLVIALGVPKEEVKLESVGPDGSVEYWRDKDEIHHVPKRTLEEIILE